MVMNLGTMESGRDLKATIKPLYEKNSEYTISPTIVPNTNENFDITITINETGMSKKMTVGAVHNIEDYVASLESVASNVVYTSATYNGTIYDVGIRYVKNEDYELKNNVYYNCYDTDKNGIAYGYNNYDYSSSCEIWKMIGVFDVDNGKGSIEKRVKLINTESTFKASYDSSSNDVNSGFGINQWGEIKDTNGNVIYEGSDLMRLLNGYYIGVEGATCTYCNGNGQEECSQTCDTSDNTLASQNMKPLSNNAKSMIENAVWDTYGVKSPSSSAIGTSSSILYLEEKGISQQYKGNSLCDNANTNYCDDTITRTTLCTL